MGTAGAAAVPTTRTCQWRLILVGDGIKIPKRGKKMPAVKLLHQQSDCCTKPEYIMGHSLQAVCLLVDAALSVFAVPLAVRIHEGLVWSNRDKRTLLDKMLLLIETLAITTPFTLLRTPTMQRAKLFTVCLNRAIIWSPASGPMP